MASSGADWARPERLARLALQEMRFDLMGVNAIHGAQLSKGAPEPYEVRLRAVGRAATDAAAVWIPREVEALYTNGPAGGGGAWGATREVIAVASVLMPRERVVPQIEFLES